MRLALFEGYFKFDQPIEWFILHEEAGQFLILFKDRRRGQHVKIKISLKDLERGVIYAHDERTGFRGFKTLSEGYLERELEVEHDNQTKCRASA